jgi:hypothetical protein
MIWPGLPKYLSFGEGFRSVSFHDCRFRPDVGFDTKFNLTVNHATKVLAEVFAVHLIPQDPDISQSAIWRDRMLCYLLIGLQCPLGRLNRPPL